MVALVPPEILQAAPELMRLLDAANFLAARKFRLGGKLEDEAAQGFLEAVGELLVVQAVGIRGGGAFDGDESPRLALPATWEPFWLDSAVEISIVWTLSLAWEELRRLRLGAISRRLNVEISVFRWDAGTDRVAG